MIPSASDISEGMTGALRLAIRDPDALESFDISPDGFLKSFAAIVLTFPLWLWLVLSSRAFQIQRIAADGNVEEIPALPLYLLVEGAGFFSSWIIFLFMMSYVTRLLEVEDRYLAYVVVYNWASLFTFFVLVTPIVALSNLGLLPDTLRFPLSAVTLFVEIYFFWYITCRSLDVDGLQASAVVALELMLVLFIAELTTAAL